MTQFQASKAGTLGPEVLPLSVEAYHALGEMGLIPKQTELLYGQVFHKISKSPLHSFLAMRLLRLLQTLVPTGCLCRPEQPITCQDSEPEPDLAVVRGREEDFYRNHPRTAELLIEVCVTTQDHDRSKLRAYANAGVKECWFVLAPDRQDRSPPPTRRGPLCRTSHPRSGWPTHQCRCARDCAGPGRPVCEVISPGILGRTSLSVASGTLSKS